MYDGNDWSGRKEGQPFFAQIQLVGGKYRDGNAQHFLHLFDPARLTAILERAGFRVETVQSYGDVPLLPGRMGFVATKPT